MKGRKNPRIRLSLLEYRQGHLHIPLFQDIFWQEIERQLKEVCSGCRLEGAGTLPRLKSLLEVVRRSGHGAIFLLGLSQSQLDDPHTPIENQVQLAEPVPLAEPWLQHLAGLAKSDGAVIFNDRLEACQFRARLKPANICLLPDQDDLGSGMRHQVTREFSAYAPGVLGVCVSQDSYISLYRHGKLVSRLY
ncbi:MAG: diadenylate cyclase [Desulfobacterales bacterium]|nr:diadenylate cyclase [Desulfobacterales bacterium]